MCCENDHMSVQTQASHRPRSGEQFEISAAGYSAVIASVGATLRVLRHGERDLVAPFDADEVRPQARGAVLAPWPNRVADGRYNFGGETHKLPLTEPERGNAIHGLVMWQEFAPTDNSGAHMRLASDNSATHMRLTTDIVAQPGYPFQVRVTVDYHLDERGLTHTVTGENLGGQPAPWGAGFHPYLVAEPMDPGDPASSPLDSWTLSLPASELLVASADRLLPLGREPLSSYPEFDFRAAQAIGDVAVDHAFTGLGDEHGHTLVTLTNPEGSGVGMEWGPELPWVQLYTSDSRPGTPEHRHALAVEPMTCPADAFNSGTDLVVLEPGEAHSASWRIFAI